MTPTRLIIGDPRSSDDGSDIFQAIENEKPKRRSLKRDVRQFAAAILRQSMMGGEHLNILDVRGWTEEDLTRIEDEINQIIDRLDRP